MIVKRQSIISVFGIPSRHVLALKQGVRWGIGEVGEGGVGVLHRLTSWFEIIYSVNYRNKLYFLENRENYYWYNFFHIMMVLSIKKNMYKLDPV